MAAADVGPLREPAPSARDIPVAVPGDVVLVRSAGLAASVGAVTVTSAGFEFTLSIATGDGHPDVYLALNEAERDRHAWLEVRFADGRGCAADLNSRTWSGGSENLWLDFLYGDAMDIAAGFDSRWWVSPLPPP